MPVVHLDKSTIYSSRIVCYGCPSTIRVEQSLAAVISGSGVQASLEELRRALETLAMAHGWTVDPPGRGRGWCPLHQRST